MKKHIIALLPLVVLNFNSYAQISSLQIDFS